MKIDTELTKKMLSLYGRKPQLGMIEEECMELAIAIHKYLRFLANQVPGKAVDEIALIKNIVEEAADCYIVLETVKVLFGEQAIQEVIDRKTERQWGRVDGQTTKPKPFMVGLLDFEALHDDHEGPEQIAKRRKGKSK